MPCISLLLFINYTQVLVEFIMLVVYGNHDVVEKGNIRAIDIHDDWVALFQGDT